MFWDFGPAARDHVQKSASRDPQQQKPLQDPQQRASGNCSRYQRGCCSAMPRVVTHCSNELRKVSGREAKRRSGEERRGVKKTEETRKDILSDRGNTLLQFTCSSGNTEKQSDTSLRPVFVSLFLFLCCFCMQKKCWLTTFMAG